MPASFYRIPETCNRVNRILNEKAAHVYKRMSINVRPIFYRFIRARTVHIQRFCPGFIKPKFTFEVVCCRHRMNILIGYVFDPLLNSVHIGSTIINMHVPLSG